MINDVVRPIKERLARDCGVHTTRQNVFVCVYNLLNSTISVYKIISRVYLKNMYLDTFKFTQIFDVIFMDGGLLFLDKGCHDVTVDPS